MSQPILLQDEFLGMYRDKSRDQLPRGKCWNLVDWIPEELGAPLRKRGGWTTYGQALTALDASAGAPARVGVAKFAAANEIRLLKAVDEGGLGGTFTLTFQNQTTGAIAYNASASTIQTALEALSNIAPGDVSVTDNGTVAPETIDVNVQFTGTYAATDIGVGASGFTYTPSGLTGSGTFQLLTVQNGGAAGTVVVAIDDRANPELFDLTNSADRGSVYGATAAAPMGPMVSYRSLLLIPSPALSGSPTGPRKMVAAGTISALGGSPPGARYLAIYKDRVVACSADSDTPNRVFFSGAGDAESWDTTNRYIDTSAPPVAVAPLRNSLLVFHSESVERIRGSIPPGSAAANMELEPLFDNVGLADAFALQVSDEFVYWADEDGVYRSDGSSFTDLTKQGGMSRYWRDTFADADAVALAVWRGYVWVSLTAADGELDTLLYHIDKRYWFKLSNIIARNFAIVTTDAADELIYANRDATMDQVGALSSIFEPELEANLYDGDGENIIPILDTSFFYLGSRGDKRWRHAYLTYDLYDSQTLAPTLELYRVEPADPNGAEVGGYTQLGEDLTETNSNLRANRVRRPISNASWGQAFRVTKGGDQAQDIRIYALEVDVQLSEGTRRGN